MQRRISRYINSELLKARLKLTGINSSSKNQEQSRFALYRFEIFPIVHFSRIARDTRAFMRGSPVRFPLSRARRNLAAAPTAKPCFENRVFPRNHGGIQKGRVPTSRVPEARFGGRRDIAVLRTASSATAEAEVVPPRPGASPIYLPRGNSCVYFLQNRKKEKEDEGPSARSSDVRTRPHNGGRVAGHGGARARDRANTRRPTRVARVTMSKGSKRSGSVPIYS